MDQASTNVREAVAFARRMACRTLTVVGGVAAGTALAWMLSTASASAAEQAPDVPGVADVVQSLEDAGPVDTALTTVGDYLQDPPPPPKDPLKGVGEKLKDAAEQFREHTETRFDQLPDCAGDDTDCGLGLDRSETPPHHDGAGHADFPSATPVAAPVPVDVQTTVAPDTRATATAKDRAFADGMSRRGSPEPAAPASSGFPTWPAPFTPGLPTAPVTCHLGQSGGSFADSHLFAALPWQDSTCDLVAGGTSPATGVVTFTRPGTQPGVAPD